jgi:hypothetical protein
MTKMKPWRIAFMMLAAFSLASCSKEDPVDEKEDPKEKMYGAWDPMEWKADEPLQITDGVYNVSADKGTVSFTCSNYSSPWLSSAEVDGKNIHPEKGHNRLIDSENFRAEMQENKLTVHFKANESAQERSFSITVTAGDIFYTFRFEQAVSTAWQSTCQVKYSIYAISDDMRKFFDFAVEYLDVNGQLHTEVITDNRWDYVPDPISFADAPEKFMCRIVAVIKDNLPELTEDYYEIGYGVDVHVAYLNADGEEVFRVKQPQYSSFTWFTTQAGMRGFLDEMHEIELATCSPTISKAEVIEKMK